jgi:hypothetical protein
MRHGFTEADLAGSGSDVLSDALIAHRSPETIYQRLNEHLDASANHVGIQVLTSEHDDSPMSVFRTLTQHRPA